MFVFGKFISALLQPLAWSGLLVLLALRWQIARPRAARRALWAAAVLLWGVGWMPLPEALLRQLENRYPVPQGPLQGYVGVVVLGGGMEKGYVEAGREQLALNAAAERLTMPVALLHQYPHLRLLFSGGEGSLNWEGPSEADRARRFFLQMGLRPDQLILEAASRTTDENAQLSAALPGVDKTQPWLLLTSAWHMPRSLASFQAAGWNVTPYPVDFRSGSHTPWLEYSLARGALDWQLLLHEWVGMAAYALRR